MFREEPIQTVAKAELPSPDGARTAVLYQREQPRFLNLAYWTELAIKDQRGFEHMVGEVGRIGPGSLRWTSPTELSVTLQMRPWEFPKTGVPSVKVTYTLSEALSVERSRTELLRQEAGYAKTDPQRRESCRTIRRNWERVREFHAWARRNATNGDPDPGPWASTAYPADCSTLPNP